MKKNLLVVMEAVQMNGAVMGWWGYMSAIDRNEWDIDLFLFDPKLYNGLKIPNAVNLLPSDPHCVIERVGFGAALCYALKHGRIDLAIKRIFYSLLHKFNGIAWRWKLMKPAVRQPKQYDLAIASSQGISWEYIVTKVSAQKKLLWVDTDVRVARWLPYWNYFKRYADGASGIVCVSKAMRDQMRLDNPQWSEKIFALNYVIDVETILRKSAEACPWPKTDRLRLITVGRYSSEKGQHLIPAIAEKLKKVGVDFEWYVIAPGSSMQKEKIDHELHERGVAQQVVVTEGMSNPFPVVKSADISVQPSSFEGFGLTVSEAMILGTYVVASDIPSFREQILSEGLGLFAKRVDVDAFTDSILEAVARVRAGQTCKNFQTPYSRENTYRQFKELIVACG